MEKRYRGIFILLLLESFYYFLFRELCLSAFNSFLIIYK